MSEIIMDERVGDGRIVLKSDEITGMALVQERDGNVNWVPVESFCKEEAWEDKVRDWSSKLGICNPLSPTLPQRAQLNTPQAAPVDGQLDTSAAPPSSTKKELSLKAGASRRPRAQGGGFLSKGFLLKPGRRSDVIEDKALGKKEHALGKKDDDIRATGTQRNLWVKSAVNDNRNPASDDSTPSHSDEEINARVLNEFEYNRPSGACEGYTEGTSGLGNGYPDSRINLLMETNFQFQSPTDKCRDVDRGVKCADVSSAVDDMEGRERAVVDAETKVTEQHEASDVEWIGALGGVTTGGGHGKTTGKKKKMKGKAKGKGKGKKLHASGGCAVAPGPSTTVAGAGTMNARDVAPGRPGDVGVGGGCKGKRESKRSKRVTFGIVSILELTRDVGGCGVPTDGSWGLAVGVPIRETWVDVDGYETDKEERLEERSKGLSRKQRHASTGETRQFDHRPSGEANPLFSRLGEKERSTRLLDFACYHKDDVHELAMRHAAAAAARKLEGEGEGEITFRVQGRGRGQKHLKDEHATHALKISHAEFVDKSQAASAELQRLRASRTGSQGCRCAIVRAEKLTVARLREELKRRGRTAGGTKRELVNLLNKVIREEEQGEGEGKGGQGRLLCAGDDCECAKNGIECHADLCNCCKGHHGKQDAQHGELCQNKEGVYAYVPSQVDASRAKFISAHPVPGRERARSRAGSLCSDPSV